MTLVDTVKNNILSTYSALVEFVGTMANIHRNMRAAQTYLKKNYDLKRNYCGFEEGVIVYKLNKPSKPGQTRKLQPIWLGAIVGCRTFLSKEEDHSRTSRSAQEVREP